MQRDLEGRPRDPAVHELADRRVLSANELLGRRVVDAEGEEIGAIADLYLDVSREPRLYVLVDAGGFLGIGAKPVLVSLLQARLVDGTLRLTISREEVERAPEFDEATGAFRAR